MLKRKEETKNIVNSFYSYPFPHIINYLITIEQRSFKFHLPLPFKKSDIFQNF